jgi:hypothetical protein
VLVVGDSIAKGIGAELRAQMADLGYCADVYNAALSATSACRWAQAYMRSALAAHRDTDIVVAHFVGNQGPAGPCPMWADRGNAWLRGSQAALTGIRDTVNSFNLPLYTIIPAPAYHRCRPPGSAPVSGIWRYWAHWQESFSEDTYEINLRAMFGAPAPDGYQSTFTFANGSTGLLRTDTIRGLPDCLHFTRLGYQLAADAVRAAIAREWA